MVASCLFNGIADIAKASNSTERFQSTAQGFLWPLVIAQHQAHNDQHSQSIGEVITAECTKAAAQQRLLLDLTY